MKLDRKTWIFLEKAVIIILFLMAAGSLALGVKKGLGSGVDFQWDSAKLLVNRIDPYEASLNADSPYHTSEYGAVEANQFPSLLWLLLPYTFLGARAAAAAWLFSNLFFLGGIIILLRYTFWKRIEKLDFMLLIGILLASGSVRSQIHLGQHSLFAFFFFLLAVWLSEKNRRMGAGLALAVSYFKYSITAPLMLYFLYKKRYREIIVSVIPHILLTFFSSWWLGTDPFTLLILPVRQSSLLTASGFADLSSVFGKLGYDGGLLNLCTVLIFAGLFIWIISGKNQLTEYGTLCVLAVWSLVFMYHRRYDYFLLVLPLAALFMYEWKTKVSNVIWMAGNIWLSVGILLLGNFIDMESSVGQAVNRYLSFLPYTGICNLLNTSLIITLYVVLIDAYIVLRKVALIHEI